MNNRTIKIGVVGALGKMGQEIMEVIRNRDNLILSFCAVKSNEEILLQPQLNSQFAGLLTTDKEQVFAEADIIIDFSSEVGTLECLELAVKYRKTFLTGVTGIGKNTNQKILDVAKYTKVCLASNTSPAIAIIKKTLTTLSKQLADYDCEVLEAHHRDKKDAPSGTAISLGKAVADARGVDFENVMTVHRTGKREINEIGFSSIRGGKDVFGEHEVMFFGEKDMISIKHVAYSRTLFAIGAVDLAIKLYKQPAQVGFFAVEDLV